MWLKRNQTEQPKRGGIVLPTGESFQRILAVKMASCCLLSALIIGLVAGMSSGQAADDDRLSHLQQSKKIAELFQVFASRDGKQHKGRLADKPLLKYNDSTRQLHESTLWLWTEDDDVPCGLMAIEYYPDRPRGVPWLFEFVSLSDTRLGVTRGSDWSWNAKQAGLKRQLLEKGPVPADRPVQRLSQSKQLMQRFKAHESSPVDGRIELRPMSNPLLRYSDEKRGLMDGVVFAFANGTNPEVLLILEAIRTAGDDTPKWYFSLAQMTGGEVAAELDDQEIWTKTEADPPAVRDSYVNGWLAIDDH